MLILSIILMIFVAVALVIVIIKTPVDQRIINIIELAALFYLLLLSSGLIGRLA